jgi:hypothetical protein
VVEELEKLLLAEPDRVGDVFAIPRARIPVIKFVWKPTGTKARRRGRRRQPQPQPLRLRAWPLTAG